MHRLSILLIFGAAVVSGCVAPHSELAPTPAVTPCPAADVQVKTVTMQRGHWHITTPAGTNSNGVFKQFDPIDGEGHRVRTNVTLEWNASPLAPQQMQLEVKLGQPSVSLGRAQGSSPVRVTLSHNGTRATPMDAVAWPAANSVIADDILLTLRVEQQILCKA